MSFADVNDILEELSEDNKRLIKELLFANKCLTNTLNEIKSFVDLIFDKYLNSFDDNDNNYHKKLTQVIADMLDSNRLLTSRVKAEAFDERDSDAVDDSDEELPIEVELSHESDSEYKTSAKCSAAKTKSPAKKRFACDHPNCTFRAKDNDKLRRHQLVHSSDRPFRCTVPGCPMSFKSESNLRGHVQRHTSERKFVCPQPGCDKKYKNNMDLKKHMVVHSEKRIACDWPGCDYKCNYKYYLDSHTRQVHSTERNFVCDWDGCGKRFKTKNLLLNHTKIHLNDKRHACHWPGCNYRAIKSYNLQCHLKTHTR